MTTVLRPVAATLLVLAIAPAGGAPTHATATSSAPTSTAVQVNTSVQPGAPGSSPVPVAVPSALASNAPSQAAPQADATNQSHLPGVVDECTNAPPRGNQATVRPAEIVLACADAGLGLQDLVWSSWSENAAMGEGLMWERVYAGGPTNTVHKYRTEVTLSGKRDTSAGPVFTEATMRFIGTAPSWTGPVYSFRLNYPQP